MNELLAGRHWKKQTVIPNCDRHQFNRVMIVGWTITEFIKSWAIQAARERANEWPQWSCPRLLTRANRAWRLTISFFSSCAGYLEVMEPTPTPAPPACFFFFFFYLMSLKWSWMVVAWEEAGIARKVALQQHAKEDGRARAHLHDKIKICQTCFFFSSAYNYVFL